MSSVGDLGLLAFALKVTQNGDIYPKITEQFFFCTFSTIDLAGVDDQAGVIPCTTLDIFSLIQCKVN